MQEPLLIPWIQGVPFEPFTAYISDGRTINVTHPETVMLTEYALAIYVFYPGGEIEVIDASHIASIRSLGPVNPTAYLR